MVQSKQFACAEQRFDSKQHFVGGPDVDFNLLLRCTLESKAILEARAEIAVESTCTPRQPGWFDNV